MTKAKKYEGPAPSPSHTVGSISSLLLLTDRRVQQLSREGVIPKTLRGRYELVPAVQGYIRYLQDRSLGSPSAEQPNDYHTEKARLVKLQADKAEMEVKEMTGELVSADDVLEQWRTVVSAVKSRMLSIPSKAAPLCASEDSPAGIIEILEAMVREALEELSDYARSQRDIADGDESVQAATETDGKPVG